MLFINVLQSYRVVSICIYYIYIYTGFYDKDFCGFSQFTEVILPNHESRTCQNSRIHEQILQISRIRERYFSFSRITNDIDFTNSRTIFFHFHEFTNEKKPIPAITNTAGGGASY